MNAFLDCPSAGLYRRWLGYHALQFLESGAYNRIEFPLAPEAIAALQGTHSDCRFSFEIASDPVLGGFILDAGGFVQ